MTEEEKADHRRFLESMGYPVRSTDIVIYVVIFSPLIVLMLPWYLYGSFVEDPYDKQSQA
jgi:hypothetical protein